MTMFSRTWQIFGRMYNENIHKPFFTKRSTPCVLFERCFRGWKCIWSWGGAGGPFRFLGITIKKPVMVITHLKNVYISWGNLRKRNSRALLQHYKRNQRKETWLETPQTGMVCARPRTGRLYCGWFTPHRTSLLPIYCYPSVKWDVCIEPEACWRNNSHSAAVWQETQKYPELHHQTTWQLCSPGGETSQLILCT